MDRTIKTTWETTKFTKGSPSIVEETIVSEFPLTLVLNGKEFATMVCSPTELRELLIGFLASEGIIRFFDEIKSLAIDEDKGFAYAEVNKPIEDVEQDHSKRFIGSCCGKSRQFYFKSDVQTAKTIRTREPIPAETCIHLMEKMQSASEHFQQTGGVHNAALCDKDGIVAIRTDIGRHNALDKIYGYILEHNIPLHDKVIAFSGRISSEVLLKISKIGVGILLSKSAPTDLALELADDLGITAIGFIRGNKMNVYTHPDRIIEAK